MDSNVQVPLPQGSGISPSPSELKEQQPIPGVLNSDHANSNSQADKLAGGDRNDLNSDASNAISPASVSNDATVPNGLLQEFKVGESAASLIPEAGKGQKPVSQEDCSGVDSALDDFEQELKDMVASVKNASLEEVTQLADTTSLEDEDIFDN
ncbi:uncharacterized protein [Ptychodera flava]|uniref:uncharacterized protein n=1 Tax=Ptychodera flava TaxID=63121 RepID=UPI003969D04C